MGNSLLIYDEEAHCPDCTSRTCKYNRNQPYICIDRAAADIINAVKKQGKDPRKIGADIISEMNRVAVKETKIHIFAADGAVPLDRSGECIWELETGNIKLIYEHIYRTIEREFKK